MGERPGFSCPAGAAATRTAVIATQDMNRVLHRDGPYVTVQAGITMTQLLDDANTRGYSLPPGTVPSYLDLTLGGLLAVGAHAQGPKGASNVVSHQTVTTLSVMLSWRALLLPVLPADVESALMGVICVLSCLPARLVSYDRANQHQAVLCVLSPCAVGWVWRAGRHGDPHHLC